MKIAYFDCIGGASGDMILGALVDAGLPIETLRLKLAALNLQEFELKTAKVVKQGFSATKVEVHVHSASRGGAEHKPGKESFSSADELPAGIARLLLLTGCKQAFKSTVTLCF